MTMSIAYLQSRVSLTFWRGTGFHRLAKLFELNFIRDFAHDGQRSWAKSSSQLINLPNARPFEIPGTCYFIAGLPQHCVSSLSQIAATNVLCSWLD